MKIRYVFRHLDQSDFIKAFAKEHVEKILSRHSANPNMVGTVKLEMENSPQHPGQDAFRCEIVLNSPGHSNLVIKKRTSNMYEAITAASEKLGTVLEKVKGRIRARRRRIKLPVFDTEAALTY